MEKNIPLHFQEVIFSSSNQQIGRKIKQLEKSGDLRKIAARIYTPNFTDSPEAIIRRNIFTILGTLYPGSLLSHRSALEFQPTATGNIFVTHSYTKRITLPGITIRFIEGHPPIEGDNPVTGELYSSQFERALLENFEVSKKTGPESKTLTIPEIEDKLERAMMVRGESAINEIRDKARILSEKLGLQQEFEKLNMRISALLNTHTISSLSSPLAIARSLGHPYDPARIGLFEKLLSELKRDEFPNRPEKNISSQSFKNFAFYEAYFSNYIEGTEFKVETAKKIIDTNTPLPARKADSHDILGTYKIVSNEKDMYTTPMDSKQFMDLLLYRHRILLNARPEKNPGEFKDINNRAGNTEFVHFSLVKGTLIKGFDYLRSLENPFAKAIYIMFIVSEIHPFLDGNGRIARIMLNAELVRGQQTKIIIPTVFREDYLGALRKLTRQAEPSAYIRMMQRAQEFSATIVGEDSETMEKILNESNAFEDPENAKLKIITI